MQNNSPTFLDYFKFRKDYLVTPAIFYINLILYVAVSLSEGNFWMPSVGTIVKFGGNANYLTLDGQWWRMISSMFLHYGPIHFLSNMYALTRIGFVLENFVGKWRLISIYFFTGICASMLSTWWHTLSVGVGASGAIFGLFGLFLALVTTEFVAKENRRALIKNIGITIVINLVIGTQFNIDNSAHIGGLIAGIVAGYLIYGIFKSKIKKRELVFCCLMVLFSIGGIFSAMTFFSKDPVQIVRLVDEIENGKASLIDRFNTSINAAENGKNDEKINFQDSSKFYAEWDKLGELTKELLKYKMDGSLKGAAESFHKEIPLRKREIQLLYQLNQGQPLVKVKLDSVQKALQNLLSKKEN
ncbi:MAG: rhomboid family intramembrane serine protease [Bacteroidia bacterium]|nr:rhomboid family intramembrane serine protease [Bacteroidia bacterium]